MAVACIEVASQAVAAMPMLLFWPLLPFLAFACLVVYWVAVAAYLYSAGTIAPHQLSASTQSALTLSVRTPLCMACMVPYITIALHAAFLQWAGSLRPLQKRLAAMRLVVCQIFTDNLQALQRGTERTMHACRGCTILEP
jgi:hypothetical protein